MDEERVKVRGSALRRVGLSPSNPISNHGSPIFKVVAETTAKKHNKFYEELAHLCRQLEAEGQVHQETKTTIRALVDSHRASFDLLIALAECGEVLEHRISSLHATGVMIGEALERLEHWREDRTEAMEYAEARNAGRQEIVTMLSRMGFIAAGAVGSAALSYLFGLI